MTIGETLSSARRRLMEAGIDDPGIEAEVLLRHALILDRGHLFQRLGDPLAEDDSRRFEALLQRRLAHEPTPYITGQREFYGLDFEVTSVALIPRPETEHLVEAAIELTRTRSRIRRGPLLADIGAGCGCIAVSLALNIPRSEVYATDVSPDALALAQRNAERHGVAQRILFLRGDLLSPLPEYVDVIVANLPYVKTDVWTALPPEIRDHEPRAALDGGPDGLAVIRRLLDEAPRFLRPRGAVCLEFGDGQTAALRALARDAFPGYAIEVRKDLAGLDRVLVISPRG